MRRVDVSAAGAEQGGEEGLAGRERERVREQVVAFYAEVVGAAVEGGEGGGGGGGWVGEGEGGGGVEEGEGEGEGEGCGMEEEEEDDVDGEEGGWWVHFDCV